MSSPQEIQLLLDLHIYTCRLFSFFVAFDIYTNKNKIFISETFVTIPNLFRWYTNEDSDVSASGQDTQAARKGDHSKEAFGKDAHLQNVALKATLSSFIRHIPPLLHSSLQIQSCLLSILIRHTFLHCYDALTINLTFTQMAKKLELLAHP